MNDLAAIGAAVSEHKSPAQFELSRADHIATDLKPRAKREQAVRSTQQEVSIPATMTVRTPRWGRE
jgi:hypothetical protein